MGAREIEPKEEINILAIEDKKDIQDLYNTLLTKEGYNVAIASNGAEGIKKIGKEKFDLIILDLKLPDISEEELLNHIADKMHEIPVIIVTAYPSLESSIDAIRKGVYDYIVKPIDPGDLMVTIQKAAEKIKLARQNQDLSEKLEQTNKGLEKKLKEQTEDLAHAQMTILRFVKHLRISKEDIEKERKELRYVLEKNVDGIVITDKEGVVHFVNSSAEIFLGREKEKLIGNPVGLPINSNIPTEIGIVTKSGAPGVAETRVVEIEWENKPAYFISLHDITERKELENSQRLAQLGKIIGNIAHEVNNPLMVILWRAQISLMEKIDNSGIQNNLQIIAEQCMIAKNIIQRVLKFSRPSRGEVKEIDIAKSIEETISIIEHQFSLSGVEIKRDYSKNLPMVLADEKQIQEVFMNLLNNAYEAMSGGGTIEINISFEDNFLQIDIKDTGRGIDKENLPKLFEPFFTTKDKGTGLGVSICYSIIKAHQGDLKYKSSPGKGTTVTVLLPLAKGKNNV